MITRCCLRCEQMVKALAMSPNVEVLSPPVLNQALVRFLDPAGQNHDARTQQVVQQVNDTGEAFFSTSMWRGLRCMRISVCNWRTSESDVERALSAFSRVLARP